MYGLDATGERHMSSISLSWGAGAAFNDYMMRSQVVIRLGVSSIGSELEHPSHKKMQQAPFTPSARHCPLSTIVIITHPPRPAHLNAGFEP